MVTKLFSILLASFILVQSFNIHLGDILKLNMLIEHAELHKSKYGDNFVYLKIDAAKGIIGCQQLPNIEIQRLEGARQSSPNQSDRES